jgi:hypothetical protein
MRSIQLLNSAYHSHSSPTSPVLSNNLLLSSDLLIPLVVLMIIRSNVQNLQSSLYYMQTFSFEHDVVTGEYGYALSSLEGVVAYIGDNFESLGKLCESNQKIWDAILKGEEEEEGVLLTLLESKPANVSPSSESMSDPFKIRNWDGECLFLVASRARNENLMKFCKCKLFDCILFSFAESKIILYSSEKGSLCKL